MSREEYHEESLSIVRSSYFSDNVSQKNSGIFHTYGKFWLFYAFLLWKMYFYYSVEGKQKPDFK